MIHKKLLIIILNLQIYLKLLINDSKNIDSNNRINFEKLVITNNY